MQKYNKFIKINNLDLKILNLFQIYFHKFYILILLTKKEWEKPNAFSLTNAI